MRLILLVIVILRTEQLIFTHEVAQSPNRARLLEAISKVHSRYFNQFNIHSSAAHAGTASLPAHCSLVRCV